MSDYQEAMNVNRILEAKLKACQDIAEASAIEHNEKVTRVKALEKENANLLDMLKDTFNRGQILHVRNFLRKLDE